MISSRHVYYEHRKYQLVMKTFLKNYVALFTFGSILFPLEESFSQNFTCDSQLYQVVDNKTLKVLEPSTGQYQTIGSSSINYNGAGYNSEDGYIYGIGSGTKLLRIDNTGQSTDLGAISNFSALSYSGDFDLNGNWYSLKKNGSSWVANLIDVSIQPPSAQEFTLTELGGVAAAVKTNDIAYNVVTHKFYGMQDGLIMEFDHLNHTVRAIADYSLESESGGYGAVWADESGKMYFFNNSTGNIYRAVFELDGSISEYGFISTSAPNGGNDGMSCPSAVAPVFPEICDNGIDDDGDGLTDCDDPDCTASESCGVSGALYNSAFGCEGSIVTYHAFFTNNSSQPNTLEVTETLPQGFVFLQDTIEFDAGGSSDFNHQPVEGDTGVITWGNLTLEGGETVRISYDLVLGDEIISGNQYNNISVELTTPGTLAYPSTLSEAIAVGQCPTPNSYSCEPAFYQVYKKKGKNQPNVYGKLNPITGDYDAIAIASDFANGLGFDMNTGLVYGASGKRFIQLDADGVVIDQGISFSKNVYRGDINDDSEWYGVVGGDMVKIDVSEAPSVVATYSGQGLKGWDLAFHSDGHFYSLHNQTLEQFNTDTNTRATLGTITGVVSISGGYGAQWGGSDGYLYASHNATGKILRIDVATLEARVVSHSTAGLSKNDGFSCPTEIPVIYEFDYGDNSAFPQSRVLSYRQDLSNDNVPDFSKFWLGNTVNFDDSDPSNAEADGDLDDGFTLSTEIAEGEVSAIIGLNANMEGLAHYMLGIDWDDNGSFDDVIIDSEYLTGSKTVIRQINVPSGFSDGDVNFRIIITESDLTADQLSGDIMVLGEVEDYRYNLTTVCEGENCEVTTGNNGGLESNGSLARAVAKRNYGRVKTNSKMHIKDFQPTLSFYKTTKAHRTSSNSSYFPSSGLTGHESVTVSSPEDLIGITNAVDLFAVDYYLNEKRVAASLLLETNDEVYDHSKNVCERLNGKSIEETKVMNLDGIQVIYAKIKDEHGAVEYSSWFSVKDMDDQYEVYSRWNVDNYPAGDYLNFQAWGSTPGQVFFILKHVLEQLRGDKDIVSNTESEALPEVIVKKGRYENGALIMTIMNTSGHTEAEIEVSSRNTEQESFSKKTYTVSLNGNSEEEILLETGHLFDAGLSVRVSDNAAYDALYLADGAWGADFNSNLSIVSHFQITEVQEIASPDSYLVERDFSISGTSSDVVNVFRNLKAGERSLECSEFSTISFDIENDRPLEIVLVEKGLVEWDNRLKYIIPVHTEKSTVILRLEDFIGTRITENLELKSIVFSFISQVENKESFKFSASKIKFGNERILSVNSENQNLVNAGLTVYPNPVKDRLNVVFESEINGNYQLSIQDLTGKIVVSEKRKAYIGEQKIGLDLTLKDGFYVVTVVLPSGERLTNKVIVN